MTLYAVVLRFPFTKGSSPNHEKQPPIHYSSSAKLYSWHYASGQVALSWQSVGLMVKPNSSLQRARFHCSRVQWRQALRPCSRRLEFCATARPWKPISWSPRWTVLVLTLLSEAVWNSVVCVATEDRRLIRASCFSTRRSHSVSLRGLPIRAWAVVAPRRFHFTISALLQLTGETLAGQKFGELTYWHLW
jgi:hypothetical protein